MVHGPAQPNRDEVAPAERVLYDQVVERFRSSHTAAQAEDARRFEMLGEPSEVGYFFGALLHSPQLAARVSDLGAFYRGITGPGRLSAGEREWVVEAVGHELDHCRRTRTGEACDQYGETQLT